MDQQEYSHQEARDKNKEEYNKTASAYDEWSANNLLMQKYCYYSTFNEMQEEGV